MDRLRDSRKKKSIGERDLRDREEDRQIGRKEKKKK